MYRVNSIEEFIKSISEINYKKHKDYSIFFRGESNDFGNTKCVPRLFRNKELIENEHKLYYDFISNNPEIFKDSKLTVEILTIMQHYGLPTRLLDITQNALVALYMAIEKNEEKKDGVVYVFLVPNNLVKHFYSDTVSVLSNMSKRAKFEFPKCYENTVEKFNNNENIQFLLHDIKDEKPYFKDKIVPEHLYSIQCFKPLLNNRRIIQQQGAFLIFGNSKINKYEVASIKDTKIVLEKISISNKSN